MDTLHRQHLRAALTAAVLVLVAHLLVLEGGVPRPPAAAERAPKPVAALQVRQLVVRAAEPPVAVAATNPTVAAATPPAPPRKPRSAPQPAEAATPLPAPAAAPLPRYDTQLPPSLVLAYSARRGDAVGHAELRWQAEGGRYELSLRTQLGNAAVQGLASAGLLDADGLAPERQVELQRGRELRAVNFQRESGRITFSGPGNEWQLLPGAQDRLSWIVQLAAIFSASPRLAAAGQTVQLFVAGPRGDAQPWTFQVLGAQVLAGADGTPQPLLHLRRDALQPYDHEIDVWLDPALHHLPQRLRLAPTSGSAALELLRAP